MKTKLITALIVILGLTQPASADTFTEGGINYRTLSDNTVAVTTGTYTGTVNVPQTVNHGGKSYTITEIGDSAFFKCADVTSVAIPAAVTRLGIRAFANSGITEVTIPVNVTDIDKRCFSECKSLKTMNYNAKNCQFTNYSTYSHFADCEIPTINIGNDVQILPHG
ncbi:MAG: leucine-rich repeat domain-containing protein, partial [Muribaculaceae bacterium]|nr:leucine-rich repeat domain-containing protein [Muribaculaceae bacterium]